MKNTISGKPSILGAIITTVWGALGGNPGAQSPSGRRRSRDRPHRYTYIAHCGIRARARRVGGATWQEYRDHNRAHRGLSPL